MGKSKTIINMGGILTMDLSTLVKMSNTYGSNPAYVLAGGGNTSVKDDTTLYVKGSGTQLATIKAEEFVEMSRARLNEIMKTDYPEDDVKRESLYLADVMAAIARALLSKPQIIIADEPTGNLDGDNSANVIHLLKTICKEFKQTVIIVTHDLEIAYGADAVIKLKDGKIVDNIRSNGNEN